MTKELRNDLLFYIGLPVLIGFVLGSNQTGFGTQLPWTASVVYWVTATLMAWIVFHIGTLIASTLLRPWESPLLAKLALGLLIASIPSRLMLNAYAQHFYGAVTDGAIRSLPAATLTLEFALSYARTWAGPYALWLSANLFFDRVVGFNRYRMAAKFASRDIGTVPTLAENAETSAFPMTGTPDFSAIAVSPLLSVLPPALGFGILALRSEDHYLRIYTDRGDTLILYRLTSAIQELQSIGFKGVRVHRSFWVAIDAVVSGHVERRQHRVRLSNGLEVPVSQTYRQTARMAGLPV